jgi:ribose transport system substrate-binding protein
VRLIGGSGTVGLIPFVPGAATSELRERGFREGLEGHPEVELVATLYSYSDVARGMSATEDMLTSNPDLDGIFAANESGAMGAVQALEAANRAGEVKLVAFDAAERQVEALRAGTIQALVVQNPFQMGYQGVKSAVDHLEGREVPERIDTGVTVVTPRNIEDPDVVKVLEPLPENSPRH